jgi:HEAT repeat protein
MYRFIVFVLFLSIVFACSKEESGNRFKTNETFIKIANLQDKRSSDSLISFFTNEDASVRTQAVLAFASLQDSTAVNKLANVLTSDADTTVRISAAVALGQTRSLESD